MNKIKLNFVDFWEEFDPGDNFFSDIIKKKYEIILDEKNPDFVFCSVFGKKYKRYCCPRILYSGENSTPNFNVYDYGMGFDYMQFEKRYLRLPIYYLQARKYDKNKEKYLDKRSDKKLLERDFCNFVYSNSYWCDPIREEIFKKLSQYKPVKSGGKVLNNIGGAVDDKYEFQKNFKFSIACENSTCPGYITEKIYDAFIARTIPIYWGNPYAARDFNPKAFINAHDFKTLDDLLKKVIEIDNNDDMYLKMLNEPFLVEGKFYNDLDDEKILEFFDNIFKNPDTYFRKDILNNRGEDGRFKPKPSFKRALIDLANFSRKYF